MKLIIGGIFGVLCVYLLGAFVEASFNTMDWTKDARFMVALFMPVGALTGFTFVTTAREL
jgi:biotin transporter BioY